MATQGPYTAEGVRVRRSRHGAPGPADQTAPPGDTPAEAMYAVAAKLNDFGFGTCLPADHRSRRLTIVNAKRARSEIIVDDACRVTWVYWPMLGDRTDPADIVGVALSLLGSPQNVTRPIVRRGLTLKSRVGETLRQFGLHVEVEVNPGDGSPGVASEVVVTNPTAPFCGHVRVTDDARITWECDTDGPATQCALAVADTIVPLLTHGAEGMCQLWLNAEPARKQPET
jgi:hypothetical protein